MTERFISLIKNGPKGFVHMAAPTPDYLMAGEFGVFTDDPSGFPAEYADVLPYLAGVVVAWGPEFSAASMGPLLWRLTVPKGTPRLQELVRTYFTLLRSQRRDREAVERLSTGCGAESERKYRYLYENAFEGIFVISREGRFLSANPAMVRILGYDDEDDLLDNLTDIVSQCCITPEDRAEVARLLAEEGQLVGYELRMVRKDRSVVWTSLSARAVSDCTGKRLCYEGSLKDITERKRRERAERERKAAEAANRAKSNFLAVMSHEIRTPMNAILGMADLLWESPLNPEQKQYVQTYRDSGEQLLGLIDSILDMSKVEAGQMELEHVPFDLEGLIEKTMETMVYEAHRKGLELIVDLRPEVPKSLIGDSNRLRQVLVHVLGNGIKFTHEGDVLLEVDVDRDAERAAGETVLRFMVRDTGIGISPEKLPLIFDAFVQEDSSMTRRYGGTGLGLCISRSLVRLMGGEITVESGLGAGSVFTFTARFKVRRIDSAPALSDALRDTLVLVADDHSLCRRIIRENVRAMGGRTLEADSGTRCIEVLAGESSRGRMPDLMIIDDKMPGMGGVDVLRHLRGRGRRLSPCVLLVTAERRDTVLARAEWAGSVTGLVKPVTPERLRRTLARVRADSRLRNDRAERVATNRPLKVLLVEDNDNNRMLFNFFLKRTPYEVTMAVNGREGVEKRMSGDFDVVFMDLEMPVMNGYEAARTIRSWEEENREPPVPIIALTANTVEDREKSSRAGCDAHMTKPFRKNQLLDMLASLSR